MKHNFHVLIRTSSKSATSVVVFGFVWYSDAGFLLISFRKKLFNSLPHILTSELWQVFAVSNLAGKQRNKF